MENKKINSHSIIDVFLYIIAIVVCFFLFSHTDILITAQNSTVLLEGNILDFYTKCHELSGEYGANYLPSTYFVFAIWNLPLKLLGLLPKYWGDWNNIFFIWNKLLPSLVFCVTAYLIYKISKEILEFDILKAKMTSWIFLTSPIAFYCQFIFSQYDIFTVFFMLLGMYYYFKIDESQKNKILFILFFGIATTFKYFALVYFFVLLLLYEKNVKNIICNTVGVGVPAIISSMIYLIFDFQSFKSGVLGFGVLNQAQGNGLRLGLTTVNVAVIAICVILAWVYFTEITSEKQRICYSIYFCCAISFALFAFLKWHPQWLILAVPFWSMAFVLNKKTDIFIWVDIIFGIVFNVLIVNIYAQICDESQLRNGILSKLFRYKITSDITMAEVYRFDDVSILFGVVVAVLLIYFIFNHPNRMSLDHIKDINSINGVIRLRFIVYIASFFIPIYVAGNSMIHMPELWWKSASTEQWRDFGDKTEKSNIYTQTALLPKGELTSVKVYTATHQTNVTEGYVKLLIKDDNKVLAEATVGGSAIKDCEEIEFVFSEIDILENDRYTFVFETNCGEDESIVLLAKPDNYSYVANRKTVTHEYKDEFFEVNGDLQDGYYLMMSVYGYLE